MHSGMVAFILSFHHSIIEEERVEYYSVHRSMDMIPDMKVVKYIHVLCVVTHSIRPKMMRQSNS
jgi:hypothetical protein